VKSPLKIGLTIILSAYMFIISCGFSISNITCSVGDQWVIGAEMPSCKYLSNLNSFICLSKESQKTGGKKNDNRKKDTFDFKFEFIGNEVSHSHAEFISFIPVLFQTLFVNAVKQLYFISNKKNFLRLNPPSELFNPDLALLQVFRI